MMTNRREILNGNSFRAHVLSHSGQDISALLPYCVNLLHGENAAWGSKEVFFGGGGQFEPFIKVFEVEQRRRRCCRCAFLRSLRGCIPMGLRLCITAILPAFRMSLKSCYFVCSCCVLVEQKSQTLQQKTNPCMLASVFPLIAFEFTVSNGMVRFNLAVRQFFYILAGIIYCWRATYLTFAAHTFSCRLYQMSHGQERLKANLHSTPGWALLSDLWNRTGIVFCSCSVITCTAAGEKLYATWLFDNELSIASHSKKKKTLQHLF